MVAMEEARKPADIGSADKLISVVTAQPQDLQPIIWALTGAFADGLAYKLSELQEGGKG